MKKAFAWKLLERFGVQAVQFVLQVILARMLMPEHYGILAIMFIFINLANIIIQSGLNTALIQNKDVTERDYSSVLWVSLLFSAVLYAVIFLFAPLIAYFYATSELVLPLRVLALVLFPGAVNSVQLAKVSREKDFKKVFFGNIWAIIGSGAIGIAVAYFGGGLWALVCYHASNIVIATAVMRFTVGLKIYFSIDLERIKTLFAFGWKLLVSGLADTLYISLQDLIVGKKYSSQALGFYNRGKQFPQFFMNSINGAVQSVMLPVLSEKQGDKESIKQTVRKSIAVNSFIIFPIMAGLAGIAKPMTELLLTEKWLPCLPYVWIFCFSLAFYPIHSCNLQVMNAIGRSDLFLKLEIIKKSYGTALLIIAVFCFDTPIAIALTTVVTAVISLFVNAVPNKKLIGYSIKELLRDILPQFAVSLVMLCCVIAVGMLNLSLPILLAAQILVGASVYVLISALTRMTPFLLLANAVKESVKAKIQ